MLFRDRVDAGRRLGERLLQLGLRGEDALVLALPRGGVPVAAEIAHLLQAPLDVFLVRKLRVPGHEELAMGAIASGGALVLNEDVIRALSVPAVAVDAAARAEAAELARREQLYRPGRGALQVAGHSVILVDDGLATGSTMRAAALALRELRPATLTIAVPVSPVDTCADLARVADRIECLATPSPFYGVGQFYRDFRQITDAEVLLLLAHGSLRHAA